MAPIPRREWEILRMRHQGMTRPQVGAELGLTSERIRQLEADGKERLAALRRGQQNTPQRFYFTERFKSQP